MKIKVFLLSLVSALVVSSADAQTDLVGVNTSGDISQINLTDGSLTLKAQEAVTSIDLGAVARRKGNFYYVAAPSGTTNHALFIVNLASGTISKVFLDRSDTAKTLFFFNSKLHGIFYNGNTGDAGVYKINIKTGTTTLVVDLSSFKAEPVGGAISRSGLFFFSLLKPTETTRQLVRFRLRANSATVKDILAPDGKDVICDKIKNHPSLTALTCVASPSLTEVKVCKLSFKGVAKCLGTLTTLTRIGAGHTMMKNGKKFYVFGYAPADAEQQRLVTFNAAGKELANSAIPNGSIFVGARFGVEDDDGAVLP